MIRPEILIRSSDFTPGPIQDIDPIKALLGLAMLIFVFWFTAGPSTMPSAAPAPNVQQPASHGSRYEQPYVTPPVYRAGSN